MEVIEDQLDSNRPIQGVKLNFDQLQLAAPRAAAPRVAFRAEEGPVGQPCEPSVLVCRNGEIFTMTNDETRFPAGGGEPIGFKMPDVARSYQEFTLKCRTSGIAARCRGLSASRRLSPYLFNLTTLASAFRASSSSRPPGSHKSCRVKYAASLSPRSRGG
jgi:hypothetical protein